MIEDRFDVEFVSRLALREKQIQQNYRPYIAVHKWFARRPGTLFRGLLLSEFGTAPLPESFCESHQLQGITVADPFMGGGTPLVEANRLGCDVVGFDINPMAYWIVSREIEHLDTTTYRLQAAALVDAVRKQVGHLYVTTCQVCGMDADVKYFLWVKTSTCHACSASFDLWPGMLLAKNTRHVAYVLVCSECGQLNERDTLNAIGSCDACSAPLTLQGNASRGRARCPECTTESPYPNGDLPQHRLFAIEYYCPRCKSQHKGRFFKSPDEDDHARVAEARERAARMRFRFVPRDEISPGDETNRLIRWGYRRYRDMFNDRQLVGLELSCRVIDRISDNRIRNALATNLSDLLRYQNMLCRYDTMALKSLDVFSVHGFPVSLIQCESNLFGIRSANGAAVGSGGWDNIIAKYARAKEYCSKPFETVHVGKKKQVIRTATEWIGDQRNEMTERRVNLRCEDATTAELVPNSLDAVFTDPPYFGNIQYAELMDFCYVWLKRLVGQQEEAFACNSTRRENELTGNTTEGRDLAHFTEGVSRVFRRMAAALKVGAPLAFTFHHNDISAYAPIATSILDSGLTCTGAFPCPAEMGGSIHINGTGSSIIDTVFVCRTTADTNETRLNIDDIGDLVSRDLATLRRAGYQATPGDIKCIFNGHATRLAIDELRPEWRTDKAIQARLQTVLDMLTRICAECDVASHCSDALELALNASDGLVCRS